MLKKKRLAREYLQAKFVRIRKIVFNAYHYAPHSKAKQYLKYIPKSQKQRKKIYLNFEEVMWNVQNLRRVSKSTTNTHWQFFISLVHVHFLTRLCSFSVTLVISSIMWKSQFLHIWHRIWEWTHMAHVYIENVMWTMSQHRSKWPVSVCGSSVGCFHNYLEANEPAEKDYPNIIPYINRNIYVSR